MIISIALVAAVFGVGFAGAALLLPDTGVNGSLGATLALMGALTVALTLGLLVIARPSQKARDLFAMIAALIATLTALAAWFLMQDTLVVTMVISIVALVGSRVVEKLRIIK